MNPCARCIYHAVVDGMIVCDYLLITGHRRPCPPGKLCTVRTINIKGERKNMPRKKCVDDERARELIASGLGLKEAAAELDVSVSTLQRWKAEQGLTSGRENPAPAPEGTPSQPPPPAASAPPEGEPEQEPEQQAERERPEPDCVSGNQSWIYLRMIRECLKACGKCLYTIGELMELVPGGAGKGEGGSGGTAD